MTEIEIKRDYYLQKLLSRRWNRMIKVITGIRRCGKSYLLFNIFKNELISQGVEADHILEYQLDSIENASLRDPDKLYHDVIDKATDGKYYVLIDEIQFVKEFESVLNGFLHYENLDVYVTGSNSRFLSSDIITEFRGRGDQIHMQPLSFSEYVSAFPGDKYSAWESYSIYGGLPYTLSLSDQDKAEYLVNLMKVVYQRDIKERYGIRRDDVLDELIDVISSSVGSPSNPSKLCNTIRTEKKMDMDVETVSQYIGHLEDAFLFERSKRYDIKGRKYFDSISKYYAVDIGLRNAKLGFRQIEKNHIMENVIYNELRRRGFEVDVGLVESRQREGDKVSYKQLEIDFVANKGYHRYYIQSAFYAYEDKRQTEIRPFLKVKDSFRKILITGDNQLPWMDDNGILTVGLLDFLLDPSLMDS